ncbi:MULTISPECIES: hypothetical protein [Metallosphaera]
MSALYFLSPYIPMIFMWEKYGVETFFNCYSNFSQPELVEASGKEEG